MAMTAPIDISESVAPVDPSAAAPTPVEPTAEAPEASLSDDVLRIPALQAVFAGAPPAVSFNVADASKTPEAKLIGENKQALAEAGIGFYRSLAGDTGVMFNTTKISGEDIKAADKAGKLSEIAPSATEVSASIQASGANHPALAAGAPNNAPAAPTGTLPPPTPMTAAPASAGAARDRLAAQLANLKPSAPTAGARPGAGRLLNAILKPVL